MAAIQLSFSLRVSNVKTVHLLGSWDGYQGQLPLSKDSSKKGSWKGTFRFQGSTLQHGQRYWYYYIIDGYHVTHDPSVSSTREPTTGRELNILDVPPAAGSSSSKSSSLSHKRGGGSISSIHIPKGRPLSSSEIKSPKPEKPYVTRHMYDPPTADELASRFSETHLHDNDNDSDLSSSPPSTVGSLSSRRSGSTSASSLSDFSSPGTPVCSCQRFGITRKGDRVKLDCGGSRCGGMVDSSEECSSESEEEAFVPRSTRRQGIFVRR